ncbi:MAG: hypothetical protein IJV00_10575, partial [Clostridia bacterium]|nr:hypothetical protein [Clostridia bacterium]
MKKIICALLVVLMTLSIFAACADPKKTTGPAQQNTNGNAAQTGGKPAVTNDDLDEWGRKKVASAIPEDKKFDGETVNFVLDSSRGNEFTVEALNGDLINDAVYNRNLKVESDLGITLNYIVASGSSTTDFAAMVSREVFSGAGDYDLIAGYAYFLTAVVRNWCYANFKEIEEKSSMDLTKPWWNQFYVSEATLNNQLYTVTGDLAISSISSAGCIFFNKRLADEHLSAWGGTAGLYKLVEDGEWTFDKFTEICKDIYNDADGDGQRSEGDFYAFSSWWSGPIPSDSFQFGMDARITRMDENGVPYLDYYSDRGVDVVSKLYHFNADSAGVLYNTAYYNNGEKSQMIMDKFINGTLIFVAYTISSAGGFGDMKDDFGLLPMPKYNKEQDKYYTSQSDGYSAFAIAADVIDREKEDLVGTTLEKLNEESYRSVAPNFFETVMKYRYLRTDAENQKDIAMYDIIKDGNNFNFGLIYSSVLDNVSFGYRYMIGRDGTENFASFWGGKEATVNAKFNALIEDLM